MGQYAIYSELIAMLVWKELSNRYRLTALSFLWPILATFAMLGIYGLVFSRFMRISLGPGTTYFDYLLFLFCGTIVWNSFAETTLRCTSIIHENQSLIKKLVFPAQVYPVALALASFLSASVFWVILIAIQAALGRLSAAVLFLPLAIALQIVFTTALGWLLASIGAYYRDVREALVVILGAWVFLTPIFYPTTLVPEHLRWLLYLNPMTTVIETYRRILLSGRPPDWALWLPTAAAVALIAWLSHGIFERLKGGFADVV